MKIHLLHPLIFVCILVNTKHCLCARKYSALVKTDVVLPQLSQHLFRKQTLSLTLKGNMGRFVRNGAGNGPHYM